jgi:hypothetical protein
MLGLGAVQAGAKLGQVHIFDYYRQALGDIGDRGLADYLRRIGQPYFEAAAGHLDPTRTSFIEFALKRKFRPGAGRSAAARQRRHTAVAR